MALEADLGDRKRHWTLTCAQRFTMDFVVVCFFFFPFEHCSSGSSSGTLVRLWGPRHIWELFVYYSLFTNSAVGEVVGEKEKKLVFPLL